MFSLSDPDFADELESRFDSKTDGEPKFEISANNLPFGVFVQKCVIAFKVALICHQLFTGVPILKMEDGNWVFELNNQGTPVIVRTNVPFVELTPEEAFEIIIDRVFAI